jgi:hypothetical protein
MDLTRIKFIKESKLEDLQNSNYLENLIIKLGFNTEILHLFSFKTPILNDKINYFIE